MIMLEFAQKVVNILGLYSYNYSGFASKTAAVPSVLRTD